MTDTLPKGWEKTTVGNLCFKVTKGTTPTTLGHEYKEEGVRFVKVESLDGDKILYNKCAYIDDAAHQDLARSSLEEGDVLISIAGTLGRTALVNTDDLPANTNQAVALARPVDKRVGPYLLKHLNGESVSAQVIGGGRGVGLQNLNLKQVSDFNISLPPLNEQHRIVEKIDALMERSGAAKEALDAIPKLLNQYRQSVLASAFRGDLTKDWREKNPDVEPASKLLDRIRTERRQRWEETELAKMRAKGKEPKNDKWKAKYKEPQTVSGEEGLPDSWCNASTDECFYFVTSGSRGWAKYYADEGPLFLRVGNLDRLTITLDLDDIQCVQPPEGAEGSRTQVQQSDILISITADIGMIACVDDEIGTSYVNQHVALARPVLPVTSKYISWYLASHEGQKQLGTLQRGATKAGLGLDDIRAVTIPFASLEEQKQVVSAIESALNFINSVEAIQKETAERLPKLNQSILAKAFRGELVSQDENDEPASVLLDRIRQERAKADTNKPKRGRKKKAI